jgi:hypothetical protein
MRGEEIAKAVVTGADADEGERPGYLLQFVEPRVITENTVRHGLVVEFTTWAPGCSG